MLAVDPHTPTAVVLRESDWERAGVLIRWFYGMAEGLFVSVSESAYARELERRLGAMLDFIRKSGKGGVSKAAFSRRFARGTTSADRERDIYELEARCEIEVCELGKGVVLRAVSA